MTSTLGVWMLNGYGTEKAPRLMQLSVHCDHFRSDLNLESRPLTLRRNAGRFDHPAPEKDMRLNIRPRQRARVRRFSKEIENCSSALRRNTDRFERVFSDIRRKTWCFDKVFFSKKICSPDIRPWDREKLNHFEKIFRKQKTASQKLRKQ